MKIVISNWISCGSNYISGLKFRPNRFLNSYSVYESYATIKFFRWLSMLTIYSMGRRHDGHLTFCPNHINRLNTAGACGEDVNCPIQRWCHLCGQVQQVVKGPRSEECPPFDGKHPPKEGPDESPRCPLCEGNMTVMQHWVPEIKRLRPYWRCAGTNVRCPRLRFL